MRVRTGVCVCVCECVRVCVRLCVHHGVCVSQCVCSHVMFMWYIRIGIHTHMHVRMQWSARQVHWRPFWFFFEYSILWQIQIIMNTFTMQISLLCWSLQHHTPPRFSSSFLFNPQHPPQVCFTLQSQYIATHCSTQQHTALHQSPIPILQRWTRTFAKPTFYACPKNSKMDDGNSVVTFGHTSLDVII